MESQGYSSIIKMLVGIDSHNKITELRVLEQMETPGLGANIEKIEFYEQFTGLTQDDIALKNEGGEIDGVTGATISSRAVIAGVKDALGEDVGSITNNMGINTIPITNDNYEHYEDEYDDNNHDENEDDAHENEDDAHENEEDDSEEDEEEDDD